jgi:hypothetical protein
MWLRIAAAGLLMAGAAVAYASGRWRSKTAAMLARLDAQGRPALLPPYDERTIEGLPPPVVRFFRSTLQDGQPIPGRLRIVHEGRFRMGEADDSWQPFTSTEVFTLDPPGFVWDARIRMAPGVAVHVRDSYLAGEGAMHAAVLGLVPVVDVRGTPEMAAGALQRYLGEAAWFPQALLPRAGLAWTPIDDDAARATLTDGGTTVSLDFRFSAAGDILGVHTDSRYREVRGAYEPTPWSSRCTAHATRGGVRMPLEAEVGWHIDGQYRPYWRGRVVDAVFTLERAPVSVKP